MHLPEPIYPCYLPVLGEFNRMTPHEGSPKILPETCPWMKSRRRALALNEGVKILAAYPAFCWGGSRQPRTRSTSSFTSTVGNMGFVAISGSNDWALRMLPGR